MVPENWLHRVDQPEVKKAVFGWLDQNPYVPKKFSYSTRSIAYEFLRRHREYTQDEFELIRDAAAEWYNKNQKLAESATEDAGGCAGIAGGSVGAGLGPNTAGVPQSGSIAPVSCPELHKKKKRANEDVLDDVPEENKHGNCYQTAFRTFYDNLSKKPLLCHGLVMGRGPLEGIRYNHAWVEIGDQVIDKTMSMFKDGVDKEVYYMLGGVDEKMVYRYNDKQIAEKVVEQETYGPWEEILWQYP
ncbi:MAG: hypothetical protein NC218_01375 [Acetobacter sp.]|nr:hypothetical protein [Acetobacter sp.]